MRTRIFWIGFGVLTFIILVLVSISAYFDWQVYTKGGLVGVRITRLPRVGSGFMDFEVSGSVYHKRITSNNGLHVGDSIQLKYLKGYEGHFLFAYENPLPWIVFTDLFLVVCGVGCFYYAFKKGPPAIKGFGIKIS